MENLARTVGLVLLPLAMLAFAGVAEAHSGAHGVKSAPFAAVKANTSSYCPLDGHPLKQYCPHAAHFEKTRAAVPQIDRDCAGDSSGKIPPKSGFDNKPVLAEPALSVYSADDCQLFGFSSAFLLLVFLDSPEHPPKP